MKKAVIFLVLALAAPVYALDLTIYTEEFPPFNYTQHGKIAGVSTEVVQHIMAETGYKITIKSLPWSEAYERAQTEKNALIYSISRRKKREPLFKWIGILTPTTYSVKALTSRNDIKFNKLEDLKQFNIGTNTDDAVESWLLSKGFSESDFTRVSGKNSIVKLYRALLNKEIDVWPVPDAVAFYTARQEGQNNPEAVMKTAYPLLELSGGYYIAGSLRTPDTVITDVRKALEKFKQTDDYYNILSHWGLNTVGLKTTEPIQKLIYVFKHIKSVRKVGYLANDKLATHKEAGMYRNEMREEFVERYAKSFKEWQTDFLDLQGRVDAIILGDVSSLKGWNKTEAIRFLNRKTRVPTGYVLEGMSAYTMVGYEGNDLIINNKIADNAGFQLPRSVLKKASRVIN